MTKNTHLITSVLLLSFIALAYGVSPHTVLPLVFDFKVESVDLQHVFRAIMGLYLGNIALWTMGVLNPAYWRAATIANVVFMVGLAAGRLLSLLLDGLPSPVLQAGLVGETGFAIWGMVNLKKYGPHPPAPSPTVEVNPKIG